MYGRGCGQKDSIKRAWAGRENNRFVQMCTDIIGENRVGYVGENRVGYVGESR